MAAHLAASGFAVKEDALNARGIHLGQHPAGGLLGLLRVQRGQPSVFYLSKTMSIIDEDGSRISIRDLRDGEKLRVYYTEMDGNYYATHVMAQ